MIHQIYPVKDATLYEGTSSLNTGLDQILELEHVVTSGSLNRVSRILTQFDLTSTSESIASGDIVSPSFYLILNATEGSGVPIDYTLEVYPVSQSWTNGTGRKFNNPSTTDGVAWLYRTDTVQWTTSSYALNTTGSYNANAGGATWYTNATASFGASLTFPSIEQNDVFYVTASDGSVFTFTPSGSTTTSSSFTNGNPATASILIGDFTQNNQYIVSASTSASIIFVDDPFLFDDIPSSDVYYFSNSGSQTGVGSSASIDITSGKEGNQYIINDGTEYTFIAADLPVPADVPSANVYYFLSSTSSLADVVASMSIEINAVTGLNVTSSVSASAIQLTGSLFSTTGNDYTFTSGSTTVTFEGGIQNDVTSSIKALVDQINDISGIGLTATSSASTLILTSSLDGIAGNLYTFTSGSTVTTLEGGVTASVSSGSFTLASDDTSSDTYYFVTGSSISGSLFALSGKINDIVTAITTTTASNVLHATGSGNATAQQLYGIQSGSTQVLLSTPVNKLTISGSQRFNYAQPDTRIDVTNIVNEWLTSNIPNNGFILKRPLSDENATDTVGTLKFFSTETHTIYVPTLQIAWDNQSFTTGSLSALSTEDAVVYTKGLKKSYKINSKERIRLRGRTKYPARTFATSSANLDVNYLPTTTYWQLRDTVTNDVIIPFDDNFTKVSCDSDGNYFDFWTSGLSPNRYYKFEFKVVDGSLEHLYGDGNHFKVVR